MLTDTNWLCPTCGKLREAVVDGLGADATTRLQCPRCPDDLPTQPISALAAMDQADRQRGVTDLPTRIARPEGSR